MEQGLNHLAFQTEVAVGSLQSYVSEAIRLKKRVTGMTPDQIRLRLSVLRQKLQGAGREYASLEPDLVAAFQIVHYENLMKILEAELKERGC